MKTFFFFLAFAYLQTVNAREVSYDKNFISEKVTLEMGTIRDCYKQALVETPGLHGRVRLKWDILETGKVDNVDVVSALDSTLDNCITGKVSKWIFPKPPGGKKVTVRYPFVFRRTKP